uniref:Uncharacterized protein n=1 Tax=Meloidogyne incognita TaxID=6306 RepID=A0A914NDX3_MELIC
MMTHFWTINLLFIHLSKFARQPVILSLLRIYLFQLLKYIYRGATHEDMTFEDQTLEDRLLRTRPLGMRLLRMRPLRMRLLRIRHLRIL